MTIAKSTRNPERFCRGKTKTGASCRAYALKNSDFCYVHHPRTQQENLARLDREREKANRKRTERRAHLRQLREATSTDPDPETLFRAPRIESMADLRRYLCACLPLAMEGMIGPEKTRLFVEIVRILKETFVDEGGFPPPPVVGPAYEETAATEHEMDGDTGPPWDTEDSAIQTFPPDEKTLQDLDLGICEVVESSSGSNGGYVSP